MISLDTDHVSILQHADSATTARLQNRLLETPDRVVATTAITLEKQSRS